MFGLNKTDIIGNVGSAPELKFTPNGKSVTSFSVATNRRYTRDGERVEEAEWFTVIVWGKLAESCNTYVKKGQLVYASGRIHLDTWETQEGKHSSRLELQAHNIIFLSKTNQEAKPEVEELDPEDILF